MPFEEDKANQGEPGQQLYIYFNTNYYDEIFLGQRSEASKNIVGGRLTGIGPYKPKAYRLIKRLSTDHQRLFIEYA